jgi:hypothetical protein
MYHDQVPARGPEKLSFQVDSSREPASHQFVRSLQPSTVGPESCRVRQWSPAPPRSTHVPLLISEPPVLAAAGTVRARWSPPALAAAGTTRARWSGKAPPE